MQTASHNHFQGFPNTIRPWLIKVQLTQNLKYTAGKT